MRRAVNSRGPAETAGPGASGGRSGVLVARLAELPGLVGRRVRVGATVAEVQVGALLLRDGAATGRVRLTDAMPVDQAPLATGEVVNVTGTVTPHAPDGWELVATTADLTRAGRLALPSVRPGTGTVQGILLPGADPGTSAAPGESVRFRDRGRAATRRWPVAHLAARRRGGRGRWGAGGGRRRDVVDAPTPRG